ncbi:MAG: NAD(P)-dependent oxidoreductase [Chromatiales bacterium]|jgi:3-hydroxyisobutyrate dehydrogenase-like beta-hydroxyacid dehydrogenase|nr:NAD(P)-dependent oxidoreductase [Chromatiales bacterium]
MKVGFIGLGTMGAGISLNAIKGGHELVVSDLGRNVAAPQLAAGATWASTPKEVGEACDIVFTSLPGPKQVEAVTLGEDGLIAGMRPGTIYVDLSTNSPTVVRALHAKLADNGIDMLDAPVSGGPDGAKSGKLAIWVGGSKEVFERALPVLNSMGDAPYYVGEIGAGSVAKLVHNLSGYMVQTAMAEAFTMGVKAGVPAEDLWGAVRQGALGRRRTFDTMSRQYLAGRFDPPDFALELAHKDVSLALEVGREYAVPMRLGHMTLQDMTEAMNRGWQRRDSRSAMLLQEERAGDIEVRIPVDVMDEIMGKD